MKKVKLVIEIAKEELNYIRKLEHGYTNYMTTLRLYEAVINGRPLEDYLFPHQDKHIDEWLDGARKNGQFISEHMKRNCTDCILDGTDACSRGAGRAVDSEVCKDFFKGADNDNVKIS